MRLRTYFVRFASIISTTMLKRAFLFILFSSVATIQLSAQKIGLVLSGGGADGMAHIGVIKALEENEIPIDYITGTSMGALIGALYASGYSIEQIEGFFTTRSFQEMARGEINQKNNFFFRKKDDDASILTVKFDIDSILRPKLPTNILSPAVMDFEIMKNMAAAEAAANYDFNQLMVPFRCIAADIEAKEEITFSKGSLSEAVRASISYPFFIKPIKIGGKLLFDGGLYNNFPVDVMCEEFTPDFIIGSNVSKNASPPDEDDLLSQIRSMLVSRTHYSIECINGVMIEPAVDFGVFNFNKVKVSIDSGYQATLGRIDEIKRKIRTSRSKIEIENMRKAFNQKKPELKYKKIKVRGINRSQTFYVGKTIAQKRKKDSILPFDLIRRNYYRLHSDPKINYAHPKSKYDAKSKLFELHLDIKKSEDLHINVGGNFASRPVSHGFVGFDYYRISKIGFSASGNYYFGKLYSSGKLDLKVDFPTKTPFYIKVQGIAQRWNYFESRVSSLFQKEKPSFVIQKEKFTGLSIGLPAGNQTKVEFGGRAFWLSDEYYQTPDFTVNDTVDISNFQGFTSSFHLERNTHNDKLFPTEGKKIGLYATLVWGVEQSKPGSTSSKTGDFEHNHAWLKLRLIFDNYFFQKRRIKLGWMIEGVHSSQGFFDNPTETIIRAPAFQPTPDSRTLFLEAYRANAFLASGLKFITEIKPTIHLRTEGYVFQPYQTFSTEQGQPVSFNPPWESRYFILAATGVYKSPIGPVSVGVNYYHNIPGTNLRENDRTPLTFLFNFGYLIFNKRVFD